MNFISKPILIVVLAILATISINAQDSQVPEVETVNIPLQVNTTGVELSKPGISNVENRKTCKTAKFSLSFQVDSRDDFFTALKAATKQVVKVYVQLEAKDASGQTINAFQNSSFFLQLDLDTLKNVYEKDLGDLISQDDGTGNDVTVSSVVIKVTKVGGSTDALSYTSLVANYSIVYGYDVKYTNSSDVAAPINLTSTTYDKKREVVLGWEHLFPFDLYEIELCKVPWNTTDQGDPTGQSVTVDWSKALSVIIPVKVLDDQKNIIDKKSAAISVIQGTGLYVWRVRAIGRYHDGDDANGQNYGLWQPSSNPVQLSSSNGNWFQFTDVDSNKNTIYSKIFTEDHKVKEVDTYANGLLNTQQTQVYVPSAHSTIITQSLQDYSDRTALTTMPIPVDGHVERYQQQFTKTTDGQPYGPQDFDTDNNYDNPAPMDETGKLSYYNNNPDARIPNSNGYPYSRTLYYNDGTGRVKEQSAPGSTFKIGGGHTVKYYYETASQSELVKLFGSDAPNAEDISKVITVDQNGISTVSYKNLQGKVIATSVLINDDQGSSLLPISSGTSSTTDVTEKVTNNVKTENGFYSSKQIYFSSATTVHIDYSISQATLEANCTSVTVDCHYQLEISAINIETGEKTLIYGPPNDDFDKVPVTNGKKTASGDLVITTPGVYVIQKKLYPGTATVAEDQARQNLAVQIEPLFDLVKRWDTLIVCMNDLPKYYASLSDLSIRAKEGTLDELTNDQNIYPVDIASWSDFINYYQKDNNREKYEVDLFQVDANGQSKPMSPDNVSVSNPPDYAHIWSGCCDVVIPVKYTPRFKYDATPALTDPITPDFEGYAINYMNSCPEFKATGKTIYDYMAGWPKGIFNLMVYHMLTDTYEQNGISVLTNPVIENMKSATGGTKINTNDQPTYDPCGNPVQKTPCQGAECYRYNAEDLFNCWQSVLERFKQDFGCNDNQLDYGVDADQSGKTSSQLIDDENGQTSSSDNNSQDNFFDQSINNSGHKKGRLLKWLIKRKMSKRMRDKAAIPPMESSSSSSSTPDSKMHLVEEFLNCTGYKFAKILTPYEYHPLDEDRIDLAKYPYHQTDPNDPSKYVMPTGISWDKYIGTASNPSPFKKDLVNDYYYYPISDWGPTRKVTDANGNVTEEKIFKDIRNPIYAFKYFEYIGQGLPEYANIEAATCFDDPNDCFELDKNNNIVYNENTEALGMVPCCDPTNSSGHGKCYQDKNPYFKYYPQSYTFKGDPRYVYSSTDGQYDKLLVNEFTSTGIMRCPYDHHFWSSGQRESFYKTITNYIPITDLQVDKSAPTLSCADREADQTWYYYNNTGTTGTGDTGDTLTESELAFLSPGDASHYTDANYSGKHLDPNNTESTITQIERKIIAAQYKCNKACDDKLPEIKRDVSQMLDRNCYDIGGCTTPDAPWNIPETDVDAIINTIEGQCKSQCPITTYACEDITSSRPLDKPKTELGLDPDIGAYSNLYLGIAEYDATPKVCSGTPVASYNDSKTGALMSTIDFNNDGTPDAYRYDIETNYTKEGYSWYEYTLNKEATEWGIDIDMPSMCASRGMPSQSQLIDCQNCSTGNSTFIDKKEYDVPQQLIDNSNVDANSSVTTPPVKLTVTVGTN